MASNYFCRDSHNGLAKRTILYRYFQAQVGRVLNTGQKSQVYITYLDGFSGTGKYENNENQGNGDGLELNDDGCPLPEDFGSPLVALEALFKQVKEQKVIC